MDYFKKNGKTRPITGKTGISEKEFEKESSDFIKIPRDHVFHTSIRNAERKVKRMEK